MAKDYFDRVVSIVPYHYSGYLYLGFCEASLENKQAALNNYLKAFECVDNQRYKNISLRHDLLLLVADMYVLFHDYEQALFYYKQLRVLYYKNEKLFSKIVQCYFVWYQFTGDQEVKKLVLDFLDDASKNGRYSKEYIQEKRLRF